MQAVGNHGVRLLFDPFCDVSVRWSPSGWIVRWRNDKAVREAARAAAIVRENGVRDYRGRSVAIVRIDHHVDAIRDQHLQSGGESGLRKRVRINADVQRPVDALLLAIEANRLRDCENVCFIESVVESGAAMPGSSKHDSLCGY